MVALSVLKRYAMYLVAVLWVVKNFVNNSGSSSKGKGPKALTNGGSGKSKKAIDPALRKHQLFLLGLVFEKWNSRESMLLVSFVLVLLLRSVLSIAVADVDGHVVKQLINKDRRQIVLGIFMWLGIAVPSAFINSLIKYLQSRVALAVRTKLTQYTRDKFFAHETFYRIAQQRPHRRGTVASDSDESPSAVPYLEHPECVLTEDISLWADKFAELLSSIGKPLFDLAFFSGLLYHKLGFINQFTASVLVWESGSLLKYIRPDYGAIVQEKGNLEADLRSKHTRIIAASEEIAFCRGEQRERHILSSLFQKIASFNQKVLNRQILYNTVEDFTTKYLWSAIGMVQVAIPLVQAGTSAGDNAKYFITVRRIMIRNGDAVERCLAGIKDAIEFNGYTQKIMSALEAFEAVAKQKASNLQGSQDAQEQHHANAGDTVSDDYSQYSIVIKDVPLRTPDGDPLVERLNLFLRQGDRLLVLGPNGCGKSSLFRVLCGLWPHSEGFIKKPSSRRDVFFVPQKPYLVVGTLRDQIIYPDTLEEMHAKGVTDESISAIVSAVLMNGPIEAHGGLDSIKDWGEVLSGGEKQRLGLARVFYQKPLFAILDECSSAINVEAEQEIFTRLIATGMGLITISHRQTLFKFHNKLLTFDGEGHSEFDDTFEYGTLASRSDRKLQLMQRLEVVLKDLGEDWPASIQSALGQ